jgi:predicted DsbA family dithiol-disulfide isomerase
VAQKKAEIRVFVDGVPLKIIDDLIGIKGNTRSEVVRTILQEWFNANIEKMKEWKKLRDEAAAKGYVPRKPEMK